MLLLTNPLRLRLLSVAFPPDSWCQNGPFWSWNPRPVGEHPRPVLGSVEPILEPRVTQFWNDLGRLGVSLYTWNFLN